MNKTKILMALGSALLMIAVSGCAGSSSNSADSDAVTLKITSLYGPESAETKAEIAYAEAVTKATDGQITFKWYYADSLVPVKETHTALGDSIIDMGIVLPGYDPSALPVGNWYGSLAAAEDKTIPAGFLQGTGGVVQWALNDESVLKEYDDNGMKLISPTHVVPYWDMLCKDKPVTTLAQAKGKRVRVSNQIVGDEAKAIGMVPVFLAGGEIYEAFQRGVVDCIIQNAAGYIDLGTWDIAKYHTSGLNFTGLTGYNLAMSKATWEKLSSANQKAIVDSIPIFLKGLNKATIDQNFKFFTEAPKKGIRLDTASADVSNRVAEHQDRVLAGLSKKAPREVIDPEASVKTYLDVYEDWQSIVTDDLGYKEYSNWLEWAKATPNGSVDMTAWMSALEDHALQRAK